MIKGFILTPSFNHFTTVLVNYEYNNNYMKKGKNYYYNGMSKYHNIKEIYNLFENIELALPYLAL